MIRYNEISRALKSAAAVVGVLTASALPLPLAYGTVPELDPLPDFTLRCEVEGYYKLVAVNAKTSVERLLQDFSHNLILDAGLDRLGQSDNGANIIGWCQVGTGTTPPTTGDTALGARVAGTSTNQATSSGVVATSPYYTWSRRTFRFGEGVAAGNLTEVGVGWASTGNLFSRALTVDGSGNPLTVTVLPDEYLDVTYEIRLYPPLSDASFQVTISGQLYDCVVRASRAGTASWYMPVNGTGVSGSIDGYNGSLGAITGSPSGSNGASNAMSVAAYVNGTYYRTYTATFPLNNANLPGGISVIRTDSNSNPVSNGPIGSWQISFSPAIAKTNTKILTLSWRISWGRKII